MRQEEARTGCARSTKETSTEQVAIIDIDIPRKSFQLHGATAEGEPVFRRTLSRGRLLAFLSEVPSCLVVMEACGGAHHRGREIIGLGHECKPIPPVHVKPFVKRQRNDSNDAAAIVEAAQRPTMRLVAVKPEAAQGDAMLFRTRSLLVRQRTQTINALRGHLAEFGVVAPLGAGNVATLRLELETAQASLPEQVVSLAVPLFAQVASLSDRIAGLDAEIRTRAREREELKRLMTIPRIGPICAMAVLAFAPPMESFGCGREFEAWVGLTSRRHSTSGRQRHGRITKMGQRDLRRLLVLGATSVLRHARRRAELNDPWLGRMLAEKPPKLL